MRIDYPREQTTTNEWRTMIQDLQIFTGGLLLIGVENINAPGAPRILANSLLDINGSRYKCTSTENVGGSVAVDAQNYIYAVANGNTASFQLSAAEPQWDTAKGGWYNGNNRAVVKLFYTGGQYNNKVILDRYNAMFMVNTQQPPSDVTASGVSVDIKDCESGKSYESGKPFNGFADLSPGIYRYEVKGGNGGLGGSGGIAVAGSGNPNGTPGNNGGPGESVAGLFIHHGGRVQVKVGADGGDGQNGANGSQNTETDGQGHSWPVFTPPGSGGNGGSGMDSVFAGIVARGGVSGGITGVALKGTSSGHVRIWRVG